MQCGMSMVMRMPIGCQEGPPIPLTAGVIFFHGPHPSCMITGYLGGKVLLKFWRCASSTWVESAQVESKVRVCACRSF